MRSIVIAVILLNPLVRNLHSQELEEVLNNHYAAAAQEKMSGVRTLVTTGENDMSMAGLKTTFVLYQSRPDHIRIEVKMHGNPVIQTYNGSTGWILAPQMGIPEPRQLEKDEISALQDQATYENPLWNYAEKGAQLELVDPAPDDREYHLIMTELENKKSHYYIDRESMLISRYSTMRIMGGSEKNIEVDYEDYKTERGIPFARREVTKMDGEVVNAIRIQKVELNRHLDPDLFEKPSLD